MSAATADLEIRDNRLTTLVSDSEATLIARKAAEAGLSVSAYLRARALDVPSEGEEQEALRHFDRLLDRIESDLDQAINEVSATLARIGVA